MERDEWDQRYEGSEMLWTAEANRFLVAEVEGMPVGRALDVGAGEGRNAVWLAEQGWEVTAVDFSEVGLAKGRQLAEARGVEVDWVAADLRTYRPAEASFDLVIVLYLHLPPAQRRRVHATVARALAPAGTLLVVGHDSTNIARGYGGPQDPDILFSPEDVVADLSEVAGVSVARAHRVTRPVSTDGGERMAIDALVRAAAS